MDQVFAPWRIDWVERGGNDDVDGCVFCALAGGDDRATDGAFADGATDTGDRDRLVVARSPHSYVMLNNYPYNPGHAMVVPRRHGGEPTDPGDLTDEELLDHAKLKSATFRAMRAAFDPDGFNAGLNLGRGAGGSVKGHLHTHVVPRWQSDTNFMPVLDDTKVIVQALEESYDELRSAFAEQEEASVSGEDDAVEIEF